MDPYLPQLSHLPTAPGTTVTPVEFEAFTESLRKRHEARALLVKKTEIRNLGVVEEFEAQNGKVVYVEAMWGGHNIVTLQEGVQDEIARMFNLGIRT